MTKLPQKVSFKKRQGGVVLAFCLIFLVALTVIAVGGMETTIMEERMAGNMQDYNVAFQAAEVSLEVAEQWLQNQIFQPTLNANGLITVWSSAALDEDLTDSEDWWDRDDRKSSWWGTNGEDAPGMAGVSLAPQYIIEQYFIGSQGQSLNLGTGDVANVRVFHRVTARGTGGNSRSQVMLQTTYVRPYD